MEKPAFLMAVQRVVGGVEVEHDLLRRPRMRRKEQLDEPPLDRRRIMADPEIARRLWPAQLQPIERAFAGHRRTIAAARRELARQHRQSGSWRSVSWSFRSS